MSAFCPRGSVGLENAPDFSLDYNAEPPRKPIISLLHAVSTDVVPHVGDRDSDIQ